MWEERSCRQVRQWQHWGSGCYQYKCVDGRIHIIVSIVNTNKNMFFVHVNNIETLKFELTS